MKKNLILSNHLIILIKLLLFVSLPCLTLFLCRACDKEIMIISLVLSLFFSFIICFYFGKRIDKKINTILLVISFFIANYICNVYYEYHFIEPFINHFYQFSFWKLNFIATFSIFALTSIIYFVIKKIWPSIKHFFRNLTKTEKLFLGIITLSFFLLVTIIYNLTSAFYYVPGISWDIIYTTDSSALYKTDGFFNINSSINDAAKQPLFGLFSLPFAFIAKILSEIFFMIPNGYAIFLATVQIFLFGMIMIMLCHLLKLKDNDKIWFILLFLCSFSTIVFSVVLEQYIISLFYLVLILYNYFHLEKEINYAYLSGVGTLITTGILFPLVSKTKNIKIWILNALKCLLIFILIIILFGQLASVFMFWDTVNSNLNAFSGVNLSFSERFMQYLNFVKCIFLACPATEAPTIAVGTPHISYYIDQIYNYSKIGIAILIACIVSFILNRKNKLANISFLWLLFSFMILCCIGWGSAENGLNLYSIYFSWAFIILIYLLIIKIIKNKRWQIYIISAICICMLAINIPEVVNIIQFGINYYPK